MMALSWWRRGKEASFERREVTPKGEHDQMEQKDPSSKRGNWTTKAVYGVGSQDRGATTGDYLDN